MVTCTFFINNFYATILFDSGADKSFITLMFRELLNHESSKLKETNEVEMDNSNTRSTHEILENCLLNLNNHAFNVNRIPLTIGSFDVSTWIGYHLTVPKSCATKWSYDYPWSTTKT